MSDRITELEERLARSRRALEELAERAATLRTRVESDVRLVGSLERLETAARRETVTPATGGDGSDAGEDGDFISDAWEIALINEEGK